MCGPSRSGRLLALASWRWPEPRFAWTLRASSRAESQIWDFWTCLSGFGLECIPGLPVERANGGRHGQVARQLAAEDQFNHVGLVPETMQRRMGGAVQFEREEILQFDDLQFLRGFDRLREGHLAVAPQHLARRQQINRHAVPPVFDPVLASYDPGERAAPFGSEKLHGFQDVRDDNIHINSDSGVTIFLHRNPADDEMRNVMGGQGGDSGLGSPHHPGGSGILAQNISRLVRHT